MTPERRESLREWAKAHPEVGRAKSKRYAQRHKDKIRARRLATLDRERARNRAIYAAKVEHFRQYRIDNKSAITQTKLAWYKAHPAESRAIGAKRRALTRSAMPSWTNRQDIKAVYTEAARLTMETGIHHDVDHIVPLCHPNVCGLHVHWNLQILTRQENRRKANKFPYAAEPVAVTS